MTRFTSLVDMILNRTGRTLAAACASACLLCGASGALGQVTVVTDTFESGLFSTDWDTTTGSATAVVFDPGDGAGGSDYLARVGGVSGSDGGLGVSLFDLDGGATPSSDFSITLDFRMDTFIANDRMFNVMINSNSNTPTNAGSTLNLRYFNDTWQAYNGSWTSIGLPSIAANTWHSLTVTGNNWGTGTPGTATWDVTLNGGSSLTGLQIFQNNADLSGARSASLNDRWDAPGFDVDNVTITATPGPAPPTTVDIVPTNPVAYSGIYPHMAVSNTHNEVGIGGIMKRGDEVFFVTYGPHVTTGGSDELYSVNLNTLAHSTHFMYPGNTDANRYRDTNLGIDVVGAAYIDSADTIRYLPVTNVGTGDAVGRFTGTAAHLTDPNKLYYMTMEEGLYEIDFTDLDNPAITTLRQDGNHGGSKNLPGVHGKGLYTGQGHLIFTNNGADSTYGGGLVEWDGTGNPENKSAWTIVDDTSQYTEVTSRKGPVDMDPASTDAIWATGWDDKSMFINTRDSASGTWTKFRMPKASYTHGHPNGWYTEWPRIRDVGLAGGYLMSHHGQMFLVPDTFSAHDPSGVSPVNTHHKMVVDYVEHGTQIIFANNDASKQLGNTILPKNNSNLMFIDKANLENYGGKPSGFGGVWLNDSVAGGTNSDAFLINGYEQRVIHFEHENADSVDFVVEVDVNGDGTWTNHTTVTVEGTNGKGYGYYKLPETLNAQWVRFRPTSTVSSASVYLHETNGSKQTNETQLQALADVAAPEARSQGFLRSNADSDFKLEFAADILDANGNITGTGFYRGQLNPTTFQMELVAVSDAAAEANVRAVADTTQDFTVHAASVVVNDGGTNYRLPKGDAAFDTATASGWRRGEREVVTERDILNAHGTFYEVPHNFTGGGFKRIRPITTHNLDIFDFMSWRGMLVLSGNNLSATEDGHYVESDDGTAGLWFGNVDDLWTFGAPRGEGGPWMNTAVTSGAASDPYLMTGYDQKILKLEHAAAGDVGFTIEVDFLGTGQWEEYGTMTVGAGETLIHEFDEGYSAHWVRLKSDTSTTASAQLLYLPDFEMKEMAWELDASGAWGVHDNWTFAAPDGAGWVAKFGDAITADRTVSIASLREVTGLVFDNANSYMVSGLNGVDLVADGSEPFVGVVRGDHAVSVALKLTADTDADIAPGASLTLNGALVLNGQTLTVDGGGVLLLNTTAGSTPGTLNLVDGTVGGNGAINGALNATGGTVAPGTSVGTLNIAGDLTLAAATSLALEWDAGGADALAVSGNATLGGAMTITQVAEPALGDDAVVLTASALTGAFDQTLITGTALADADTAIAVLYEGSDVRLLATYKGDANGDGEVSLVDLNALGAGFGQAGTWQSGDFNYDGVVTLADLNALGATFGNSAAAAQPAVPEPASVTLLAFGVAALGHGRNRTA